jgi:mercuric ion binding protein
MKTSFLTLSLALFTSSVSLFADSSVQLSGVHLCCRSCVTGAEKAVAKVSGATATVDSSAGTVSIKAPDAATAQKAVNSLVDAGYFGSSADATIKPKSGSGSSAQKASKLVLKEVHLCCGKCVKAVKDAVSSVKGVTGDTATKGAKTFEVTGDFAPAEVFAALEKAGLSGKNGE